MSCFRSPPVPLMQQCPSMLCSIFATGPSSSETSQISCIRRNTSIYRCWSGYWCRLK